MIQTPPLTMSDMEALTLQMQTARDLVLQLPECDPRREVKDAIRVMAAVCSVKIVVRKTKVSPKPLDVWKQLNEIVQTVKTGDGARTMGLDPTTHRIYLPAAEFETGANGRRTPKAGTFMILVVAPQAVK